MKSIASFSIATAALLVASHAAVFSTWDLTASGLGAASTTSSAPGFSATAATAGAGLSSANFLGNGFGGEENDGLLDSSPDLATVIADGQYLSFSVTTGANEEITTLTFDYAINVLARSSNTVALMSSVDGFVDGNEVATFTNGTQDSTASVSFDVSAYSNEVGPVEFRLYLYGKEPSANAASGTYLSNLTLNGTVVPEPTSAALLGLSGLALITRRKR